LRESSPRGRVPSPRDIDKFTSFLAPNARLSYWGGPAIEGIESIRNVIGPLMKTPDFKMTWQPTYAIVSASGDLGYTIMARAAVCQRFPLRAWNR
jgi:hypothetical protein